MVKDSAGIKVNNAFKIEQYELIIVITAALIYLAVHQIPFLVPESKGVLMAIWPASGIGLAALLLTRQKYWPVVILVLFITGNLSNFINGRTYPGSLGFITVNVLVSYLCALFINRFSGGVFRFDRVRDVSVLVFAAMVINGITASIGAYAAVLTSGVPFWKTWLNWWLADGLGLMIITPLIITWAYSWNRKVKVNWGKVLEFLLFMVLWVLLSWLAFNSITVNTQPLFRPFMLFILLPWAALRLGQKGVVTAFAILTVVAFSSSSVNIGPSNLGGDNQTIRLLYIQVFLFLTSFIGFVMTGSFQEAKVAEKTAKNNEYKYKMVFDNSGTTNSIFDTECRLIMQNSNSVRDLGQPEGEALGKNVYELFGPEKGAFIDVRMRRVMNKAVSETFETEFDLPSGKRWFRSIYQPMLNREGIVEGVQLISQDITAQKRAEAEMQLSESKYKTLVEQAADGIFITDKNGIYVDVNPSGCAMLGYSREEVLGLSMSDLISREDLNKNPIHFDELRKGAVVITERELVRKDKTKVNVEISAQMLPGGCFQGIVRDITLRKRIENELKDKEHELESFFSLVPDLVCIASTDGFFKKINDAWEKALGFSRAELLSQPFEGFIHPDDIQATRDEVQSQIMGKETIKFINRYRTKAGDYRYLEWNAQPSTDGLHLYAAARDITERKAADEKIKNALAEKETLLRELYHRTKNNMQVICSLLEMQSVDVNDSKLKGILLDTQNRIYSMALVHQKLYQARDLSKINLNDYINDLVILLIGSYQVKSQKVSFIREMDDVYVLIDTAIPCGLILNELVSNALKYAFPDDREGIIRVSLHRSENGEVRLEVKDNGIGLPAGFDVRKNGRLGMKSIFALGERQLNGKVEFVAGEGLTCNITFIDNRYETRV